MEAQDDFVKKRITIEGNDYYMINDFANLTGSNANAVYQLIYRKQIDESRILRLNKVIFIAAEELEERIKRKIRNRKIEQILDTKKKLASLTDEELDKLNDLLNRK